MAMPPRDPALDRLLAKLDLTPADDAGGHIVNALRIAGFRARERGEDLEATPGFQGTRILAATCGKADAELLAASLLNSYALQLEPEDVAAVFSPRITGIIKNTHDYAHLCAEMLADMDIDTEKLAAHIRGHSPDMARILIAAKTAEVEDAMHTVDAKQIDGACASRPLLTAVGGAAAAPTLAQSFARACDLAEKKRDFIENTVKSTAILGKMPKTGLS